MRTKRLLGLGAVMLALISLGACASDDPSETAREPAGESKVVMRLIAYKPTELDVPVGATVSWSQQDAGFHTVTSGSVERDKSGSVQTDKDGEFASGRLAKGKEFTFTFEEEGTYAYFCEIHPATMTGQITVG